MDMDYNEIDGGIYDDPSVSIAEALDAVVSDILEMQNFNPIKGKIRESSTLVEIDHDKFLRRARAFK